MPPKHNPSPKFSSNTPEALTTLPVHDPYGSAWGHKKQLSGEVVRETMPLLALPAPAPMPEEEAAPTTPVIEAAAPSPAPPSLLSRVVDFLRGVFGRIIGLLFSLRSPPPSDEEALLPPSTASASTSPPSPPAGPAPSSHPAPPPTPPLPAFLRVPVPPTPPMNSADFPSTMETAARARPSPRTNWIGSPWRTGDYDG